jgi:UDP:flavonoid glycosyltransferase YjiC (YdhE family)
MPRMAFSRAGKPRVLFVAEAVTLAHVARCAVLAGALDPAVYDIVVACDPRYRSFVADPRWRHVELQSIDSARFLHALARGKPVYDTATLGRYVADETALIDRERPDLIVGDFRLSLSVSARLKRVPYATVTNAYWSPFFEGGNAFPIPVLPLTRCLPVPWAQALFDIVRPLAMASHCKPLNRVRVQHGLASLGNELRRVYTDADFVLYADGRDMFPMARLPPNHHWLGPLAWSPPVALPDWWDRLDAGLPCVYVTLGSSGSAEVLSAVLQALADLPINLIASGAGASAVRAVSERTYMAPFLPGDLATERAALVICNGGSLTCQQALMAGVPVLGIASNMDQFLNMEAVVRAKAGVLLRSDRLSAARIRDAVGSLLSKSDWGPGVERLRARLASEDAPRRFADLVRQVLA